MTTPDASLDSEDPHPIWQSLVEFVGYVRLNQSATASLLADEGFDRVWPIVERLINARATALTRVLDEYKVMERIGHRDELVRENARLERAQNVYIVDREMAEAERRYFKRYIDDATAMLRTMADKVWTGYNECLTCNASADDEGDHYKDCALQTLLARYPVEPEP